MPQTIEKFRLESPSATPSGYVSLKEALDLLGKSHATMERYIASEKVLSRMVNRPGRKPERVFLKASIEQLLDEENHRKATRPPSQLAPKAPAASSQALEKVAAGIVGFTSAFDGFTQRKPSVLITEKLWLSLEEAEELSGLARATLLKLAQSGAVTAMKSGGWKLQRKSLEAFEG